MLEEWSRGSAGLIGFIGVIVYVGSVQTQPAATIISNISSFTFDWALYFAAIGSGLVVVAAIIIALYNVDHSDAYQGKGRPAVDLPYMGQPGDPTQSNDYWAAPNAHVFHNKRDRFHSRDYLVVNSGTSSSGDPCKFSSFESKPSGLADKVYQGAEIAPALWGSR
nr:hypothetical protein BaRGS_005843 [Batillaria attramentaria]